MSQQEQYSLPSFVNASGPLISHAPADMIGAALARNPFLEDPAPGNSAIGQFAGAPTSHYE